MTEVFKSAAAHRVDLCRCGESGYYRVRRIFMLLWLGITLVLSMVFALGALQYARMTQELINTRLELATVHEDTKDLVQILWHQNIVFRHALANHQTDPNPKTSP